MRLANVRRRDGGRYTNHGTQRCQCARGLQGSTKLAVCEASGDGIRRDGQRDHQRRDRAGAAGSVASAISKIKCKNVKVGWHAVAC